MPDLPCPFIPLQYEGGALTATDVNAHAIIAGIMVSHHQGGRYT